MRLLFDRYYISASDPFLASVHPLPVIPITAQSIYSSMPPPPMPSFQLSHNLAPDIHVPTAWTSGWLAHSTSAPNLSGAPPMGAFGYGQQHLHYSASQKYWASRSRAPHPPPPSQSYSLDISAVYESSSGKKSMRSNTFGIGHIFLVGHLLIMRSRTFMKD